MSSFPLNEQQMLAATTLQGPVLIAAGAGSGKTRVLTERAANAVLDGAVPGWQAVGIEQVLAITFTDKAAGELAERTRGALRAAGARIEARRVDAAWISTIHGMCTRLLRAEALATGMDPAFSVADAVEAGTLRAEALEHVARQLIENGGGASALLSLYGLGPVAEAVSRLGDQVRTKGLATAQIVVDRPEDIAELVRRAARLFRDKRCCFDGADPSATGAAPHSMACERIASALDEITHAGLDDAELAASAWRALAAHEIPRVSKGVADEVGETKALRVALCQQLAAAITAPAAEELRDLTAAYLERFAALKAARACLDFDDLQIEAARLLSRPEIAIRWGQRFQLTMVDEFQDTDALQLQLVEAICGANLCTVGDERQSIYRFRGADIDVYRAHIAAMQAAGAIQATLSENYRSHPAIIAFANTVFGWDGLFGHGLVRLSAGRTEPLEPAVPPETPRAEVLIAECTKGGDSSARGVLAEQIADRILGLIRKGVSPGDVVILMRGYRHAEEYAEPLRSRGVDCVIVGGNRFFGQRESHALTAALRVLSNRSDDTAVAQLFAGALCDLSDDALLAMSVRSRESGSSLWDAAADVPLSQTDARRLSVVRRAVAGASEGLGRRPLSETILELVEATGMDLKMIAGSVAGEQAYANVLKMARLADQFELAGGRGPAAFVDHLSLREELGDHEAPAALIAEGSSAVRIMSIHASKGLEFPVVVVPELGATAGSEISPVRFSAETSRLSMALPGSWDGKSELRRPAVYAELTEKETVADREEMKRVFYVACTRAREALVLAGSRTFGESKSVTTLNWLIESLGIKLEPDSDTTLLLEGGGGGVRVRTCGALEASPAAEITEEPAADESPDEPDRWFDAVEAFSRPGSPALEVPRRLSYSALKSHVDQVDGLAGGRDVRADRERMVAASRVGSAIHTALQQFGEARPVDAERIQAIAAYYRLDPEQGRHLDLAVTRYRASALAEEVGASTRVMREAPFGIWLGDVDGGYMLDGTMDVLARSAGDALVVDFKTGQWPDAPDVELRFGLQARCYALAAIRSGSNRVEVVFVGLGSVGDEPPTTRFCFTQDDAAAIEAELLGIHRSMVSGSGIPSTGD